MLLSPATSVSRRRRALSPSRPPRIAALLRIDHPCEAESPGAAPQLHHWPAADVACVGDASGSPGAAGGCRVGSSPSRFALVTFAFTDGSVTRRFKKSESAARAGLAGRGRLSDGR